MSVLFYKRLPPGRLLVFCGPVFLPGRGGKITGIPAGRRPGAGKRSVVLLREVAFCCPWQSDETPALFPWAPGLAGAGSFREAAAPL